ncbi:hypothetical protein LguiB_026021 [Lonicera macranthoides]
MNTSILITNPSSSSGPTTLLFSPFLNPTPFRLTRNLQHQKHLQFFRHHRHHRISTVRYSCSCSSSDQPPITPDEFGRKKELSGFQSLEHSMSPAASALDSFVAGFDDLGELKKEDIENIKNKYGVSKLNEAFNAELCDIYIRYVSAVLPSGIEDLKGDEANSIINFKSALGIDEPDAAAMHLEIGRRIFRQRLATVGRDGDIEQCLVGVDFCYFLIIISEIRGLIITVSSVQAFQKLIYVSNVVFGEASSFLLPWNQVFKVTDDQVEVVVRDNARRLYASKLKSVGRDVDTQQLVSLRDAQLLYRLSDELAEDTFREHTRRLVEENISAALGRLKSLTRTAMEAWNVIEELEKIVAFNDRLISLKNDPNASRFARGLGPISLLGGEYDGDRKMDELKLLFRAYGTVMIVAGSTEGYKRAALNQLRIIFGLGTREAVKITRDVGSKLFRKCLSESGGNLEPLSDCEAAYLENLSEEVHFDPLTIKIHEEIYRHNLQQAVSDGELCEKDIKSLEQLQFLLCIPKQTVEAAHADIWGSLFEKVVREAVAAGVDGYDADIKESVKKATYGLRLSQEVAISIAGKAFYGFQFRQLSIGNESVVRKIFISYIERSRAVQNCTEAARELENMIAFNNLVVTELVADIKGVEESSTASTTAPEEESLKNARPIKANSKMSQTEITLKDDLSERDRIDIYKTYLLYCLMDEVRERTFDVGITIKKDDSEYVLLSQLGRILGLTDKEIVGVHMSLAEQAFRQQVEVIFADGQFTTARFEQLNELLKQFRFPPQIGQKIIESTTSAKVAAALETDDGQGTLSIKDIRELKERGVDLDVIISERVRVDLFKKTVDGIFSSGAGEFDEEEVYEKIPQDLSINTEEARRVVHELARTRLSNSLIQAILSLNNLLACDKAVPSMPLSWKVPEELADLFLVYLKNDPPPEKRGPPLLDHLDVSLIQAHGMQPSWLGLPNRTTWYEASLVGSPYRTGELIAKLQKPKFPLSSNSGQDEEDDELRMIILAKS